MLQCASVTVCCNLFVVVDESDRSEIVTVTAMSDSESDEVITQVSVEIPKPLNSGNFVDAFVYILPLAHLYSFNSVRVISKSAFNQTVSLQISSHFKQNLRPMYRTFVSQQSLSIIFSLIFKTTTSLQTHFNSFLLCYVTQLCCGECAIFERYIALTNM